MQNRQKLLYKADSITAKLMRVLSSGSPKDKRSQSSYEHSLSLPLSQEISRNIKDYPELYQQLNLSSNRPDP